MLFQQKSKNLIYREENVYRMIEKCSVILVFNYAKLDPFVGIGFVSFLSENQQQCEQTGFMRKGVFL